MRISFLVLVAALVLVPPVSGDAFDFIRKYVHWSCPMPLEEDVPLNETTVGRQLVAYIAEQYRNSTGDDSIRQACDDMECEPFPFDNATLCSKTCEELVRRRCGGSPRGPAGGCEETARQACSSVCDEEVTSEPCPGKLEKCMEKFRSKCKADLGPWISVLPEQQRDWLVENCTLATGFPCDAICTDTCKLQRDSCPSIVRSAFGRTLNTRCATFSAEELQKFAATVDPGFFAVIVEAAKVPAGTSNTTTADAKILGGSLSAKPRGVAKVLLDQYFASRRMTQAGLSGDESEVCIFFANGRVKSFPCPPGMFCPGGLAQPRACRKGYYCPGQSSQPEPCPDGSFCPIASTEIPCNQSVDTRFIGLKCMPVYNQTFLPVPCPGGSYCEDGRDYTCTAGHFCPQGASAMVPCIHGEQCAEGESKPGRVGPAVALAAAILGGVALVTWSLDYWCLPINMWWLRLVIFVIMVVFLWIFEWPRKDRDLTLPAYLTALWCAVGWGSFVSPLYRKCFGATTAMGIDGIVYVVGAVLASILAQDVFVALFMCPMMPAALLLKKVLGDEMLPLFWKLVLMAAGVVSVVLLVALIEHRARESQSSLAIYGIVLLIITLNTAVRHFALQFFPERFGVVRPPRRLSLERDSVIGGVELRTQQVADSTSSISVEDGATDKLSRGISIEFRGVNLLLPSGQFILQDISMRIPAGSSVAIMGPSGCGKSSITNVLSDRAGYGVVQGDILINGSRDHSVGELRYVTGFVPQDDVMHRNLTVQENVIFQAELRMPRDLPEMAGKPRGVQVMEEVDKVLDRLGLGDPRLRRTKIGDEDARGVSGGQRKRVSIAMELVSRPSLLFLDEPTSGLDSTTSHAVVDIITKTAEEFRCTTLAVIHQPRYETMLLFDRLILLAAGGHLVYSGPTASAYEYFEKCLHVRFPEKANPADTFMDAITFESGMEMVRQGKLIEVEAVDRQSFGKSLSLLWHSSGSKSYGRVPGALLRHPLPELDFETCTWAEEILVQVKRGFLQFQREWAATVTNNLLLVLGLLCLCIGWPPTIPEDDVMHTALALMFFMLSQGVAAQRVFGGNNRPVGWREAGSSISTPFYFIGRDIAALLDMLVGTVTFTLVYWPLGALLVRQHHMIWVCFAFNYVVWGLNYIWSLVMPSGLAMMAAVFSAFVGQLFAGVQPAFSTVALALGGNGSYLMAISPIRWILGVLLLKHMAGHMAGNPEVVSCWSNPMIQLLSNDRMVPQGMPLQALNEQAWDCNKGRKWNGEGSQSTKQRWLDGNSFVCSTKQMLLLGLYFRFVALMCILIVSRQRVHGGGRLLDAPSSDAQKTGWMSNALRALVPLFFVAFTHLQMVLLLMTL